MDWNLIAPYIVGGVFSFLTGSVGAWLVYKNQRPKSLAEARKLSEEADDRVFARMDAAAARLDGDINKLALKLEKEEQARRDEAAAWSKERQTLTDDLRAAKAEIVTLNDKLIAAHEEVRELNDVLTVVRQNGELQAKEMEAQSLEIRHLRAEADGMRGRIHDLENENHRLRNGGTTPVKDKL